MKPPRLVLLSLGLTVALGVAGGVLVIVAGDKPRERPSADVAAPNALTREQAATLVARKTGQYGHWVPDVTYYKPELPLSAVVGRTKGGTATSPMQLFFFHKGAYVGPATPEARFAFQLASESDETIVVHYSHYSPGDGSCCPRWLVFSAGI
jgi:LppP/LprE lipoprotein